MAEYTQFGLFDPASGAWISTGAPDAHLTGSFLDAAAEAWNIADDGEDPDDDGPVADNIVRSHSISYVPGPFSRTKLGW